jgi:AcrR family transcriptional regulator
MQRESPRSPEGSAVRQRNARGQGDRLRQEIIEAARDILATTGNLDRLTLRGVAREVGIAATSVYLHFPDAEHLAVAALEQTFAELSATTSAAAAGYADPAEALLARCRAYCQFGVDHPGHYRVMFHLDPMSSLAAGDPGETHGQRAFRVLLGAVEACLAADADRPDRSDRSDRSDRPDRPDRPDRSDRSRRDPHRLAALVWATEHGLVSARLARPQLHWGSLNSMVTEAVSRLMGFDYEDVGPTATATATGTA